jgi:hypothetical protein
MHLGGKKVHGKSNQIYRMCWIFELGVRNRARKIESTVNRSFTFTVLENVQRLTSTTRSVVTSVVTSVVMLIQVLLCCYSTPNNSLPLEESIGSDIIQISITSNRTTWPLFNQSQNSSKFRRGSTILWYTIGTTVPPLIVTYQPFHSQSLNIVWLFISSDTREWMLWRRTCSDT